MYSDDEDATLKSQPSSASFVPSSLSLSSSTHTFSSSFSLLSPTSSSPSSSSSSSLSSPSSGRRAAGDASTRRAKRFALSAVWLLNMALMVCAALLLINWHALHWILGSATTAILLEVLGVLMLLYVLLGGFCTLGFERRVRDSYLHLHSSPQCLCSSALALPLLVTAFFLSLSLLALIPFSGTYVALERHAGEFVLVADTNHDGRISSAELSTFVSATHGFANDADLATYQQTMQSTFKRFDEHGDGLLTKAEIWQGILSTVAPARLAFGLAAFFIAVIVAIETGVYWLWFANFAAANIQDQPFRMEGQLGITIPDPGSGTDKGI